MKTNAGKRSERTNNPLQRAENDAPSKVMAPPPFALESSATQLKSEEGEGEMLSTAAPIQRKANDSGNAPIQRQEDGELTEEQAHLKAQFLVYQRLKSAMLSGAALSQFQADCAAFIERMDDTPLFSSTARWGGRSYRNDLASDFSDYNAVLSGETARLNEIAISQAQTAQANASATLQKAREAVQTASTNLEQARIAADAAEAAAVEAEASATRAEAAAAAEGAVAYNREAAAEARTAATAARTAADEARAAVQRAEGSLEVASAQERMAEGQLEMAGAQIQVASENTDVIRAEQLVQSTASLDAGVSSLSAGIDVTTEASASARATAEEGASSARDQADIARGAELGATPIPELQTRMDAITAASAADRDARAIELITFVREQLALYPPRIATLRAQPTPTPAEKVRIIGEIAAAAARVEWLIGTIYLEGSDTSDKWETNGSNTDSGGVLSSHYQDETNASSGPWCSKFVGTIYKTIGDLRNASGNEPNGELWSGYKVSRGDYFDYDADQGGDHVGKGHLQGDQNAIIQLRQALNGTTDAAARSALVETFFTDHFRPQPGDIMVKRRPNGPQNDFNSDYESHTTMVERLDGHTIYTIEGNSGDRVAGKTYNLDDPGDVEEIVFFSRFSLNAFGDAPAATDGPYSGPTVTEAELLAPITQLSQCLQAFAQAQGYANEVAEGAVDAVYNMQQSTSGDGVE